MNTSLIDLGWMLGRNTILLAIGGLLIAMMIHRLRIRSASLQRLAWVVVLAQGWWIWSIGFDVAVPIPNQRNTLTNTDCVEVDRSFNTEGNDFIDRKSSEEAQSSYIPGLAGPTFDSLNAEADSSAMGLMSEEFADREFPKAKSERALIVEQFNPQQSQLGAVEQEGHAGFSVAMLVKLLVVVWIAGALAVLFKGLYQWLAFQFSLRDAVPARSSWQRQWQALLNQHGIANRIRILEHNIHGPLLSVTPRGLSVIVPSDYWEELKPCQRLAVLRHELAHYQRGDIWCSLFVRLLAWPHWFNPVAWIAVRRIDECAEWSCDEHLKQAGSAQTTEFAKALVALLEFPGLTPIAARSAGGAPSSIRIRRLLGIDVPEESKMKRVLLLVGLIAVMAIGLLRFQLVAVGKTLATEMDIINAASANDDTLRDELVAEFAQKLDVDHDSTGTLEKLREALATDAGQIAIGERIANHENALRQRAETEATAIYIRQYFDLSDGKYSVKAGQEDFIRQFTASSREIERDIAEVASVLKSHQEKLTGLAEADQLLKRIMRDGTVALQMYTHDIFHRIRPDQRMIQEAFADKFVLNRDNQWTIRASAREQVDQLAKQLEDAQRIANRIRRELDAWRTDLDENTPIAAEVKKAMGESSYACLIGLNSLNDDYGMDQIVDDYFGYLEGLFIDRANGLVVAEERMEEFKENFDRYKATRLLAEKLWPQMVYLAERFEKDDPMCERLRKVFSSEMASIWYARELDPIDATPADGAKRLLNDWLEADDQGNMKVRDEQQEAIVNLTRDWLRESRSMRRRGREIEDFANQLADKSLAESFRSPVGNWLVMRSIQGSVARQYFDGLESWTKEHFDLTDNGYLLKPEHEAEINDLLQQVTNLTQELANDDF